MRASLLLSSICFIVFITLDSSAVAASSLSGCVRCNENVCLRALLQCPPGTKPTTNFCKCTCECRGSCTTNPCAFTTCFIGTKCVPNFTTCTARCERRGLFPCTITPCAFTLCLVGTICVPNFKTCTAKCEPRAKCPDVCIQIAQPVCGSDGVTYGNGCLLGIANCKSGGKITQVSEGPCPDSKNLIFLKTWNTQNEKH